MEDFTRGSDIAALSTALANTQRLLREANALLGKWKISFEVELIPQSMSIKIYAKKSNGAGVIKTVEFGDIEYYSNDVETLVQIVIEEVYVALLKQDLTQELAGPLARAVTNCMRMKDK